MPLDDATRLRHMLDAARKAVLLAHGKSRLDLDSHEILALALVRLLEIVGEAAKNVAPSTRDLYPQIPWRQIGATRDRLIHGYFDVDLDIIWQIVNHDLPPLVDTLERDQASGHRPN